ncbi:LLM class flavin-dependent oxidoreductase [Mariniluteicoccus flavus]
MTGDVQVGVCVLPEHPLRETARAFAHVEELGFDHGWTYDHLVWRGLPDAPWHSTTVTLAGAALATSTLPLGTWVSSPNFRHPVTWARDLVSLQELSGGRLLCGVGSGGSPDAELLGDDLDVRGRTRRFHEFVRVLRRALDEPTLDHEGDHYTVRGYRNVAAAGVARVPLLVAASGPRGVRLAAEVGDGWITQGAGGHDLDAWWRHNRDLAEQYADAGGTGRRLLSLDTAPTFSLASAEFFRDQVGRAGEAGFTDVVTHWPRPSDPYAGALATLEAVAPGGQPTPR